MYIPWQTVIRPTANYKGIIIQYLCHKIINHGIIQVWSPILVLQISVLSTLKLLRYKSWLNCERTEGVSSKLGHMKLSCKLTCHHMPYA